MKNEREERAESDDREDNIPEIRGVARTDLIIGHGRGADAEEEPGDEIDEDIGGDGEGVSGSVEKDALFVARGELRDEREMRDLHGRPSKLKNDDESGIINDLGRFGRVLAADAAVEDEGKAAEDANGAEEMPRFASSVATQPPVVLAIRLHADEHCRDAVRNLKHF